MAAWSHKTLKKLIFFCILWKNDCSESLHHDTNQRDVFNFTKFGRWEIGSRALFTWQKKTKFCLALQLSLLYGLCPKSVRDSRRQCAQSAPDFIKSVHFWRSYTGMCEHHQNGRKVFPVSGWSLASSRIKRRLANWISWQKQQDPLCSSDCQQPQTKSNAWCY